MAYLEQYLIGLGCQHPRNNFSGNFGYLKNSRYSILENSTAKDFRMETAIVLLKWLVMPASRNGKRLPGKHKR